MKPQELYEIFIEKLNKEMKYTDFNKYNIETLIEDVIYMLGTCIDNNEYGFADGYEKFRNRILDIWEKNHKGA